MATAKNLEELGLDALEELYRATPVGPAPSGNFTGRFLCRVDSKGARRPFFHFADWLLFDLPRFGVDFDRRLWWFIHPKLAAGRFDWAPGKSRWRETETLRLTYKNSRLPKGIRKLLYDEVKPLADGTCLGLGGTDAERGEGDHFFFLLRPIAKR